MSAQQFKQVSMMAAWGTSILQSLRLRAPLRDDDWLLGAHYKLARKFHKLGRPPITSMRIIKTHTGVFTSADGKQTFRYVKALKNATSSILYALVDMTNDAKYRQEYLNSRAPYNEVHAIRYAGSTKYVAVNGHKPSLYWFLPSNVFRAHPMADIRFCVVRNPIERFVSAYLNRIQHREIKDWDGFEEFIAAIERNRTPPYTGDGHFHLQTYFLGTQPEYYTHIFNMRSLEKLETLLSKLAARPIRLRRINHSDMLAPPKLTPAIKKRIRALYAQDYEVFKKYF